MTSFKAKILCGFVPHAHEVDPLGYNRARRQTSELGSIIEELLSESTSMKNSFSALENRNDILQSTLDSNRNLIYIAIGMSVLTVARARRRDLNAER